MLSIKCLVAGIIVEFTRYRTPPARSCCGNNSASSIYCTSEHLDCALLGSIPSGTGSWRRRNTGHEVDVSSRCVLISLAERNISLKRRKPIPPPQIECPPICDRHDGVHQSHHQPSPPLLIRQSARHIPPFPIPLPIPHSIQRPSPPGSLANQNPPGLLLPPRRPPQRCSH